MKTKLTLLLTILLFACEPRVNVTVSDGYTTIDETTRPFRKASIVTGFDHQYDVNNQLIVDRKDSAYNQYIYNKDVPVFNNIALSVGKYGFSIFSGDKRWISPYRQLTAHDTSVLIVKGINNIELINDDQQSGVLILAEGVIGFPTIQIGDSLGLMSRYQDYYYVYTRGPSVVKLQYDTAQLTMPFDFVRKTFMVYNPATGHVSVSDGWGALYVQAIR